MFKRSFFILSIIICLVLVLSACGSATSPAVSGAPASDNEEITTVPVKASSAFKFYTMVDIGMTKDEMELKTGLAAKEDTSGIVPQEGDTAYYYLDESGEGVYVVYDKDLKLTSKTVQYKDAAAALTPYTSKAVTKEECDSIADGLAHADVVKLLGSEGAECSKTLSNVFGKSELGTIYRWGNPDGTFIQVVFTSDDTAHMAMYFDHG